MKKLFETCKIGNVEVKNRFVRGALWEGVASDLGYPTEELCNIYEELAQGGVGTIITGYSYVCEEEKPTFTNCIWWFYDII